MLVHTATLPWIETISGVPYFFNEQGESWIPIGQNDAITWPDLAGLFQRKDLASVENYLTFIRSNGVTCLRLMLEYSQTRHRYLENPVGKFQPNIVRLWDDLIYALRETQNPHLADALRYVLDVEKMETPSV